MKTLLNVFAGLLLLIALLALSMPLAALPRLYSGNSPGWPFWLMILVPSLLFSVIVLLIVFRHFRRRDHASAASLVTAFCFFTWLALNGVASPRVREHVESEGLSVFLGFAAPIIVALLLNRLLQNAVARHFGRPLPA